MALYFEKNVKVEYSYCDVRDEIKLSNLLAIAQEVAMEHCESFGMPGSFFFEHGKVFMLAKLRLKINRMPKAGQSILIKTKANLPYHSQYRREFLWLDDAGETLVAIDSRWVLVEIESRKICRKLPEDFLLPFQEPEKLEEFRAVIPEGKMEEVDSFHVRYSMMDSNHHVNNAVYGDFITNALEGKLLDGAELDSVEIYYHREAVFQQLVRVSAAQDGNCIWLRGNLPEEKCFEAVVALK